MGSSALVRDLCLRKPTIDAVELAFRFVRRGVVVIADVAVALCEQNYATEPHGGHWMSNEDHRPRKFISTGNNVYIIVIQI